MAVRNGSTLISGRTFLMGSDEHYPEESPAHPVVVGAFRMDRCAVTVAEFAEFVSDTGYVTVAERPLAAEDFPGAPAENLVPGSLVFTLTSGPVDLRHLQQWWTWTPGACWSRPEGPDSSIEGLEHHPVVHVAYEDAEAYAGWSGQTLPTEAQWEFAARGGLDGATYTWGNAPESPDEPRANYWHGDFPWRPDPGFGTTAPVGSYRPNGYGLFDMAGNVWEWTSDWYMARHFRRRTSRVARLMIRAAARSAGAWTRPSRNSGSGARSSRAARTSARTRIASATGPRRDGRR